MNKEDDLVNIATWSMSDTKANAAMKELRENFDKTYRWCEDCDGQVVKKGQCCYDK